MEKKTINPRLGILLTIVLAAAMARLLPHPQNVTPIGAMALFGGAYFTRKWQSFVLPLLALWLSDLVLNNVVYKAFNPSFVWISGYTVWGYAAFALMIVLSWTLLKKVKTQNVVLASVIGSTLFFIITNFGAWYADPFDMYPNGITGLMASYTLGLPFYLNSLLGDLVWCGILFGGFEYAKRQYSALAVS
jgi:hypothetical protein